MIAAAGGCPWGSWFCPPLHFLTCSGLYVLDAFSTPDKCSLHPVPVFSSVWGLVFAAAWPEYLGSSTDPARPGAHPHVPSVQGRGEVHCARHPLRVPRSVPHVLSRANPSAPMAAAQSG